VEHSLDALRMELDSPAFSAERAPVLPWLDEVDRFLERTTGREIQRFLFNGKSPLEPVLWARSAPRALPLVFPDRLRGGDRT
jgi:hypothetical protein